MAAISLLAGEPSRRAAFTHNALDRASERRSDTGWLAARAADADARFVVVATDRLVFDVAGTAPRLRLARGEAAALGVDFDHAVFLGLEAGGPLFGLAAPKADDEAGLVLPEGLKAIDLRSLAIRGAVAPEDLGIAAEARSLVGWHERHGFCSNCGAPSALAEGGWKRLCPSCGAEHFPRVDPVVIMLAVRRGHCLMGRQPRFPAGMYSALAGYVEPGETFEDAVRREIAEEAGIAVGRVVYYASQPWPFPSTLMIGCLAEALGDEIVPDETELEDCRWFSRAEAAAMLARATPEVYGGAEADGPFVPLPLAIAHWLVRAFVAEETLTLE
ncbi:MAG TPA: NAD(+) diphosphatase [Kaistiaceae bacterium]|nr:NAD(+) diphosphatase [Kaistiaceae bacterium]